MAKPKDCIKFFGSTAKHSCMMIGCWNRLWKKCSNRCYDVTNDSIEEQLGVVYKNHKGNEGAIKALEERDIGLTPNKVPIERQQSYANWKWGTKTKSLWKYGHTSQKTNIEVDCGIIRSLVEPYQRSCWLLLKIKLYLESQW